MQQIRFKDYKLKFDYLASLTNSTNFEVLGYSRIWKNGFCLHISHKKVGLIKKGFPCRKTGFVWKKRVRKSPFSEKKVLWCKKTGFIWEKKGMIKTE